MTQTISIKPARVVFNSGQFDTNFRYLRETSGDHETTLVAGPSLALELYPESFVYIVSWRFKVGDYNVAGEVNSWTGDYTPPADVANISTNIAL